MNPRRRITLAAVTASLLAAPALMAVTAVPAGAAPAAGHAAAGPAVGKLPPSLYAPYFETFTSGQLPQIAKSSGARFFTMAFVQALKKGSCVPAWNGSSQQLISGGRYLSGIASLRKMGGDVIPSFGGFSADQGGTEIADACPDVSKIAAAYEAVVTKYHVTRLDMDVEARSLTNAAGITRRSKALAMAQRWAKSRGISLQVDFTLPVEPSGLDSTGMHVLRSAIANGVHVTCVNIMVFDYYLPGEGKLNMTAEAEAAASKLHSQLASLYPHTSSAPLWRLSGMTLLPGIDDHPNKLEVTYLGNAKSLLSYARSHHMSLLSIWAIQRDNGRCPGATDSNTCSGIKQQPWAFSHLLDPFTH